MADQLLDIPIQPTKPTAGNTQPTSPPSAPGKVDLSKIEPLPANPVPTPNPNSNPRTPSTTSTAPLDIPDASEIEAELTQSGKLLQDLPTDQPENPHQSGPLASLQPENLLQTQNGTKTLPNSQPLPAATQGIELTTTHKPTPLGQTVRLPISHYLRLVVAAALTLQGLYGIFKSVRFILIEYPQLETMLLSHQITQDSVNTLATKAVITVVTTVLGLFFAMRIVRSKATQHLNTAIGIVLFVFGATVNTYISEHFNLVEIISAPITGAVESSGEVRRGVVDWIPFVQRNQAGQLEVIWEL